MTEHPVTPPPVLVKHWAHMLEQHTDTEVFTTAARWGADQELEACLEWVCCETTAFAADLLKHRRPKPPSLKGLALQALANADGSDHPVVATVLTTDQHALIRRALEALPND